MFGQAKSHCVKESLEDLLRGFGDDRAGLPRIVILEDAMSPVPAPPLDPLPENLDFPGAANRAIDRFRSAGMSVGKITDPLAP